MTQGYPLSIITYGICTLPLIRELREVHPKVTELWYANETGAGRNFAASRLHLEDLMVSGPPKGYLPDPTNRLLVVSEKNAMQEEYYFRGLGLKLFTGSRNISGFISDQATYIEWLADKVRG